MEQGSSFDRIYEVEKKYSDSTFTSPDPYCFLPTLGEMDIYLFNQGEHQRVYDVMGAHVRNLPASNPAMCTNSR